MLSKIIKFNRSTLTSIVCILVLFCSCKKDVLLEPFETQGSLSPVFDRGNITHVGATSQTCYFTKGSQELAVYQIWDSSFTFFNSVNSQFGNFIGIGRLNDSTVLIGNDRSGIGYFEAGDFEFYRAIGGLSKFDITKELILHSFSNVRYTAPSFSSEISFNRDVRSENEITALMAYKDSAWVGTLGAGLVQYTAASYFKLYNTQSAGLADDSIVALKTIDNRLVVLTRSGITQQTKGGFKTYFLPNGVRGKSMEITGNQAFIVTTQGIYRFKNEKLKRYDFINHLLPDESTVNTIHVDPAKRLWVGTENGLYLYQN